VFTEIPRQDPLKTFFQKQGENCWLKKRAYRHVFCLMGRGSDVPVFIIRGIQLKQLARHDKNDAFANIRHSVSRSLKGMDSKLGWDWDLQFVVV